MEQYIGRKIKGFKFKSNEHCFYTNNLMDKFLCEIGEVKYCEDKVFFVTFNSAPLRLFAYPSKLAIKHLIPTDTKTITKEEATALIESMTGDKYEII